MNVSRTLRGGLAAFFLLSLSAAATTLKVKSGAIHDGKLRGLIVLKGGEKETTSEQDPSKTVYWASYTVINGSDINAIDEKGIHQGSGRPVAMLDVMQEGAPLDDLDVIGTGLKIAPGPFATGSTKAAGTITRLDRRPGQAAPARDAVLGEYREQSAGNKAELRPEIEIETAKGIVKVPVTDLLPLGPE